MLLTKITPKKIESIEGAIEELILLQRRQKKEYKPASNMGEKKENVSLYSCACQRQNHSQLKRGKLNWAVIKKKVS